MLKSFILLSASLLALLPVCCTNSNNTHAPVQHTLPVVRHAGEKMNGLTMVAPPRPFSTDPMMEVKAVGGDWIAVIPYGFTRPGSNNVRYHGTGGRWWGETPEGTAETIHRAHEAGIKVMLKPQVYIPGGWTGALDFDKEEDWTVWESDYAKYILYFAQIADSTQAELFCIGTEFNAAIQKRPQYWHALIENIKQVYHGKLTYSANWDDWERVPFWKDLDYIGLGGYFPLVEAETPDTKALCLAWQPIRDRLKAFSEKTERPVLFTEYGYLSVSHCGWRNWELEQDIKSRPINEQAQANCFDALYYTFYPEPWWAGGFLWKWFPEGQGHEGYPERDYTPQGKMGEKVLKKWFKAEK